MSDPIEIICKLSGCSREDAERVYSETKDIVESVDRLMATTESRYAKYMKVFPKREFTENQLKLASIRKTMEKIDSSLPTCGGPPVQTAQVETHSLPEEKAPQNSCFQQCQIPSLEEEVQKQETACQLPYVCSCDSQCCDQT